MQSEQVEVAASVQRQGEHLFRIDHIAQLGILCFYLHHARRYVDFFLDISDCQRQVNAKLIVHLEHDVRCVVLLEARGGGVQLVGADRQRQEAVGTILSRRRRTRDVGLRIRSRDSRSLDHRLGLIPY